MKKYVKPEIFYENFELSHSIANCSLSMNHSKMTCEFDANELPGCIEPGDTVFSGDRCTMMIDDFLTIFEGYCLQTDADGFNLFNS